MDPIISLSKKYNIAVVEDAAQAIASYYKGKPLGGLGDLGTFSFHETKNIISGEGGMLAVNNQRYLQRSEIIWEKGTNRSQFFRGEVDKYGWVDIGSSFLPSELTSAYLFAQLQELESIQQRRLEIWHRYENNLKTELPNFGVSIPELPDYATNNAHMFYMICQSYEQRTRLITYLKSFNIHAVFHYLPLHSSSYFKDKHDGRLLPHTDRYADCLLRLPFYFEMTDADVDAVSDAVITGLME
jgi:dTDP-4-amino-4,6-dideoxygalactose transaminase